MMKLTRFKLALLLYVAFDFLIGGHCGGLLPLGELMAAQSGPPAIGNITSAGSTCSTTSTPTNCVILQLDAASGAASIDISGTWAATLQIEAFGGATWAAINCTPPNSTVAVTSTTANGVWQCNVAGFTFIRVRGSAYTSGTAAVVINSAHASAKSSGGGAVFASGGTTINATPKSNGAGLLVDGSIVDDGAGNITIPGKITNQGTLTISQLATPANATLVVTGGVGTNYTYKLVAKDGTTVTAANSGVSTAVGPTTLDGTHFIDINFVSQTGCTSIDVYRTVGGAAQGKIGNVACTTNGAALTLRDNALVGDASSAPATNTTGGLVTASLTEVPGTSVTSSIPLNLTQAASTTNAIVQFNGVATTGLMFGAATYVGLKVDATSWIGTSNNGTGTVLSLPSTGCMGFSSTTTFGGNINDTSICRNGGPASFRFGLSGSSAAPVSNSVQIGETGLGADKVGGSGHLAPGAGTSAGAGTQFDIARNLIAATGSVQQSQAHAFVVCESKILSNTSATTTTIATIALASNSGGGASVFHSLTATDATNFDSETQSYNVSYVNKAGTITITGAGTPITTASSAANNSGSATIGATVTGASPTISLKVTPVYGTIVPTTVTLYTTIINHGAGAVACQ